MHTVLIVDDDPLVRDVLKDICEAKGIQHVSMDCLDNGESLTD